MTAAHPWASAMSKDRFGILGCVIDGEPVAQADQEIAEAFPD
jgi:hypothetical protein